MQAGILGAGGPGPPVWSKVRDRGPGPWAACEWDPSLSESHRSRSSRAAAANRGRSTGLPWAAAAAPKTSRQKPALPARQKPVLPPKAGPAYLGSPAQRGGGALAGWTRWRSAAVAQAVEAGTTRMDRLGWTDSDGPTRTHPELGGSQRHRAGGPERDMSVPVPQLELGSVRCWARMIGAEFKLPARVARPLHRVGGIRCSNPRLGIRIRTT